MGYRFGLRFIESKKGDLPFTRYCYLYVETGSIDSYGAQAITPTDMTESEIDGQIDKLIDELETLRKKAKKKYKAWRAKN